jgi:transposase InsO family protein
MFTIEDQRDIIAKYVDYHNRVSLHSSLFYLTPEDFLEGRQKQLVEVRENKLKLEAENRAMFWSEKTA